MKKISALIMLLISVQTFALEVRCEFVRQEKNNAPYKEIFELMPSRPDWESNLRRFAYKVRLADNSFTAEVREGAQKKIASRSVNNIWIGIREPKAPDLSFEFSDVKIVVRCK